jgi:hypothetical protein
MCERGTQTEVIDDEAMLNSMSSATHYGQLDHSTMTDSEVLSHDSPCTEPDDIHSRLQELEQLLKIKSTEAAQLKLRAQELGEYDISTLRDQVNVANRDMQNWRERAEIAERKAKMFQKFTTRIRSIHSSLLTEGSQLGGDDFCDEVVAKEGRDAEGSYQVHRVRFTKSSEAIGRGGADGIVDEKRGDMGNGSVVSVKMQDYLHHKQSKDELSSDESGAAAPGDLHGMDGVASPKEEGKFDFGLAAVELWIAAQELLLMEDEEASQQLSTSTSDESSSEDQYI